MQEREILFLATKALKVEEGVICQETILTIVQWLIIVRELWKVVLSRKGSLSINYKRGFTFGDFLKNLTIEYPSSLE